MFLDFQAGTNAMWDRKDLCAAEYAALQRRLENAGLGFWIAEYLRRLGELESRRPPVGGDRRRFDDVRSYREAVARLSLATIAAIALGAESLEDAIRSTHDESDLGTLFRMAMQCQIIDDVVDYRKDLSAGLPSFLTAAASLPEGIAWTAEAARAYSAASGRGGAFPLQAALHVVSAVTRIVVAVARVAAARKAAAAPMRLRRGTQRWPS